MNSQLLGAAGSFLSAFTWAVGCSTYAQVSVRSTPFAINFTRALIALPLFLVAALTIGPGWGELAGVESWRLGWFSLSMLASYGVGDACFYLASRRLGVPGALAIASVYPVWTGLVSAYLKQALPGWQEVLGMSLAVTGVVTVILSGRTSESQPRDRMVGLGLALLTSAFWALNSFATSRAGSGMSALGGNVFRMALAMGISGVLGCVVARGRPILIQREDLRRSGWIFALESFGGSLFYVYGFSNAPLVVAATLSSLAPVLAVPVAVFMGTERVSAPKIAGILCVVAGIWLLVSRLQ